MNVSSYGLLAFAVIFGGGMLGLLLGKVLHDRYRDDTTQRIVQTTTTMISLLAALVLGLLIADAKTRFDTSNRQIENVAADLMSLNRDLIKYGPEANSKFLYFGNTLPHELLKPGLRKSGTSQPPRSASLATA